MAAPMWTSKLGGKYPRDLVERLDAQHHRLLRELRKVPHNAVCAECAEGNTAWASVSLGVFLCVRCSDVHRALGTHISKAKGCTGTYLWGPDEIARMQEVGNAVAEARYGGPCTRPGADLSKEERVELCRRKYEQRQQQQQRPVAAPEPAPEEPAAAAAERRCALRGGAPVPPLFRAARVAEAAPPAPAACGARLARPAPDLLDIDALFADFGAAEASRSADKPSPLPHRSLEAHAVAPSLDSFLNECLGGFETALAPEPALVAPPVPQPVAVGLQRGDSASVWKDFGAW